MNAVSKLPSGWRWLLILVLVALVGTAAVVALIPRQEPGAKFEKFLTTVQKIDTDIRITSAGQVAPNRKSNVGPKEGGLLTELFVEQGQTVQKGQVLAVMDTSRVVNSVAEAKARVDNARALYLQAKNGSRIQEITQAQAMVRSDEASLRAAKDNFRRYEELYKDGGVNNDEFNSRRLELDRARASLDSSRERLRLLQAGSRFEQIMASKASMEQAEAEMADAQTRLNDLTIRAPFTGVISQRYAQPGSFVSPTTTAQGDSASSSSILLVIDRLEVLATVAESDIARVRVGQPVIITSTAFPGQEFKGTVRLVAPEAVVENGITQFQVRIRLDDKAASTLKSRLNVSVNFIAGQLKNVLVVPTTAVISNSGKTGVLVPDVKKGPTFQEVKTGQNLGDKTQILSGLKAGDRIFGKLPPDVNIEEILGKSNAFR